MLCLRALKWNCGQRSGGSKEWVGWPPRAATPPLLPDQLSFDCASRWPRQHWPFKAGGTEDRSSRRLGHWSKKFCSTSSPVLLWPMQHWPWETGEQLYQGKEAHQGRKKYIWLVILAYTIWEIFDFRRSNLLNSFSAVIYWSKKPSIEESRRQNWFCHSTPPQVLANSVFGKADAKSEA